MRHVLVGVWLWTNVLLTVTDALFSVFHCLHNCIIIIIYVLFKTACAILGIIKEKNLQNSNFCNLSCAEINKVKPAKTQQIA